MALPHLKEDWMKSLTTSRTAAMNLLGLTLCAPFVVASCGELGDSSLTQETSGALATDPMSNPTGTHRTIVSGSSAAVDTSNPFFQNLGTNGRTCNSCHQASAGWTITPPQIQAVFDATQGTDPLFRLNDGANNPNAPVGTLAERSAAYSLLRTKGLIRVGMALPATREFDVVSVSDPYGVQNVNSTTLSFYRRPLPSANLKFLSAVMWDGREATGATMRDRLKVQANDATRGHAQGAVDLTDTQRSQIADFQLAMTVAQETDSIIKIGDGASSTGRLGPMLSNDSAANGGMSGPLQLWRENFFIGINDPLGGNPQNIPFNKNAFNVYDGFINVAAGGFVGYYELRDRKSGKCMDVSAQGTADGTLVQQWGCNSQDNQKWRITNEGSGLYSICGKQSNKCLDTMGRAKGGDMAIWSYNTSWNQRWTLVADGQGGWLFKNASSGFVIGVSGGSTSDGAHAVTWDQNGATDQMWTNVNSSDERRAAIRRGQTIFNTKSINIQGVRGVNDVVQGDINATLVGTCTTCHDSPNAGNHSVALPLDLGVASSSQNGDSSLPMFTVRNRTTGEQFQVTDLGRAMVTGQWKHLATFKGPILRALSSRAPYFHNGVAKTLADVVNFYDTRFHLGLQNQDKADLQAFLESL
jgi:hypothetical protein